MPEMDIAEMVWNALQDQITRVKTDINDIAVRYERAEVAENVPASTLADAPLDTDGGMSDGVNYCMVRWISNGRRPGQGAGAGTGVLAVYDSISDTWLNVDGYAAVTV